MKFFIEALLVSIVGVWIFHLVTRYRKRARDKAELTEWAKAHALELTPGNEGMVLSYLQLGAVLRTIGGFAGILLGELTKRATGLRATENLLGWVWILGGYLVGALWAEITLTRPIATQRAAALSPRDLRDYLPAGLRWALRIAGVVSIAIGVTTWLLHIHVARPVSEPVVSSGAALLLGIAGAAVAVLVESLQRLIVRRPQPVVALDLLEADDALRASSVHNLAGAGLGIVLLLIGSVSTRLLKGNPDAPWGSDSAPIVLWLVALVAWRYYGYRAWRVRRPGSAQPAGR